MITCERCNTENLDGAQYCDECGALLGGALRVKKPETRVEKPGTRLDKINLTSVESKPSDGGASGIKEASVIRRSDSAPKAAVPGNASPAAGHVKSPYAKLVINRGRSAGKEFPLNDDEIYIGRWDADGGIFPDVDLDADDPEAKVSRRHARLTRRGEQYFIEDLGSTNGTFINRGRRLLPGDRQPLRDGDEIIIGKTFLRFLVIK